MVHPLPTATEQARGGVWIVNQYAGSPRHGMEFRHYRLGRALADLGEDVTIVSGSFSHLFRRPPLRGRRSATRTVDRLRYRWLWVPRYRTPYGVGRLANMLVFAAQLLRLLRRPAGVPRPRVIVASSPSPFVLPMSWLLARRYRARFVVEVRDLWPLTLQELARLPAWHPLVLAMAACESFAYRTCDAAVSVLPYAEPHLRAHGLPSGRFHHIPNGASLPPNGVAEDGRRPDRFTVGFVGTISDANALEPLVDAASRMRDRGVDDVEIVVCGDGPARPALQARAADVPSVRFRPGVALDDVPAVIASFDACYVGFRRSSLYRFGVSPNKLYDCMAVGRPVILAADVPGSEVEDAGCGRRVPAEDDAAIAEAILELRALDRPGLDRMGEAARAFVRAERDYAVLARRYRELL